jgi:hypothetical protein
LVAAYTQGSGVDETDAGTGSQQDFLDENGQWKQYFLLQFYKTVIRNLTRKKVFQMFTDIFFVVMLETAETTE